MAYHLSIFVENKPGKLRKITKSLAENNINVRGISMASAGDFGVVKLLVDKGEEAYQALKEENVTVSKRKIIVVLLPDSPGEMHKLLTVLSENNINIEDCYGFVIESRKQAAVIIEVEKYPLAAEVLEESGYKILSERELAEI